jgi:hypothetical protein
MARTLAPDRERASLALLAAIAMLAYPMAVGQVLIIVIAGLIGWWWLAEASAPRDPGIRVSLGHRGAAVAWGVFFGLPIGLPIIQRWVQAGYQCRGGGAALSRPLSPGMDECDPCPRRHGPGADRLRPPRFLEMAPLARRNSLRIGWCSSCASLTDPLVTMRRKLPGANTSAYDTMLSDREEVSVGQVARKLVQYQHIRAHRPDTQWLGLSMMTAPEV